MQEARCEFQTQISFEPHNSMEGVVIPIFEVGRMELRKGKALRVGTIAKVLSGT
jgi:hypothetical protein